MKEGLLNLPKVSPEQIFTLRESSFANDLFITAISHIDFFNWLNQHPSNIETICNSLSIKERPADVMLTLFKAYDFIKEKDGKYFLSDIAKEYLIHNSLFDLSSFVNSLKDRPICEDMRKVLNTGKPANWAASKKRKDWSTAMEDDDFAESFSAGMNSRGAYLANGLVQAVDLNKSKKALDIGGASGIYSAILLMKNSNLKASVFEKPPVDKVAQYSIDKFGLNNRMNVIAGDMFIDDFPKNYDVHLISHVLHDWDYNEVEKILRNSYNRLEPEGKIIIHDAHINETKTGPKSIAEYSVLLMFLSEGKCYSILEMKNLLKKIGFVNIEYKPTILNRSVIVGIKPK